jgi:hypothetical protein
MKAVKAFPGARGVDSHPFSVGGTAVQARALKATGIDFFIGYLGLIDKIRLRHVIDAGLAFMPVTLAARYDGGQAVAQCNALGLPKGIVVWLDLEGLDAWNTPAPKLMTKIEAWAAKVVAAGYIAGLYVGAPQPLNGKQLYALKGITRYWLGIGRCVGKEPKAKKEFTGLPDGIIDAYPERGWCVRQDWHGQKTGMYWKNTGVFVDTNSVQVDHKGDLPVWAVAA